MPTLLTVQDATTCFGSAEATLTLDIAATHMTVRELIRARVYQEVRDYNERQPDYFRGLVQPRAAEQTLNGFKLPQRHRIDPERQLAQALAAFEENGFFILIDDNQVDDLEQSIEVTPNTSIVFLKLFPLVGG